MAEPDAAPCAQRLEAQQRRAQAGADQPSSEMYGECKALLAMFGLPYLVAPEEAEAQCAWLDAAGLVDGVVTDDNDVFLFGGRHVFRRAASPKARIRGVQLRAAAPALLLE